jgi:hypothetical protein
VKGWTKEQDAELGELRNSMTIRQIAAKLDRDHAVVKNRITYLVGIGILPRVREGRPSRSRAQPLAVACARHARALLIEMRKAGLYRRAA